jgi:hypothetical protein
MQPVSHQCQPSGTKRPSSQDPQDARGNKDEGMPKETTGKANFAKETVGVRERTVKGINR